MYIKEGNGRIEKNDEWFIRRRNYGNFILFLASLSFSSYCSSTFCHIRLYYNEFINNKFIIFLPISSLFVIMYTYIDYERNRIIETDEEERDE